MSKSSKQTTKRNPLTEELRADGDASGDSAADSYLTTDGSATTGTADVSAPPAGDAAAALEQELADQKDKYLRLAAEFENFRRRSRRERDEAGARAQADLAKALIDALDDIGRFAHVDPTTTDAATLVQGVEMVERKLFKSLSSVGLEIVNPMGQRFDPALHEAVGTEPAATPEEDHTVARVFQQGYVFNGQLLRPARVVVKQR